MKFTDDPFVWVDNLNLKVGKLNFNFFQGLGKTQKIALWLSLLGLGCWLVFGFDSNAGQIMNTLVRLPEYFKGAIGLSDLVATWEEFYGKDFHYSAVVIYGLSFYYLSKHYEKYGIVGSRNIAYSAAWTWLSIGVFELYWMGSFAYFQGQPWVLKLAFPQLRIILQNVVGMFTAGGLTALYCYVDSCVLNKKGDVTGRLWRFNLSKVSAFLIVASVCAAVFWWFYPGYVERFSVKYETGETWTNSLKFPQTLYTIDVNPHDAINAGVWFWKENNLIHGWNTLVKVLFTLTLFNIGRVRFAGKLGRFPISSANIQES